MPVLSLPVYLRRAVSMERTENFAENALTLLMITVRRRMAIHFFSFFIYIMYHWNAYAMSFHLLTAPMPTLMGSWFFQWVIVYTGTWFYRRRRLATVVVGGWVDCVDFNVFFKKTNRNPTPFHNTTIGCAWSVRATHSSDLRPLLQPAT